MKKFLSICLIIFLTSFGVYANASGGIKILEWATNSTYINPVDTTKDVAIGGTTSANSDLFVDVSANTVYVNDDLEVGNDLTVRNAFILEGSVETSLSVATSSATDIHFPYDTNTGVDWVSADSLALRTGGTNRLTLSDANSIFSNSLRASSTSMFTGASTFYGNLTTGSIEWAEDSGQVNAFDKIIASAAATDESYNFALDSNKLLTIYGEGDGGASVQNMSVWGNRDNLNVDFRLDGDTNDYLFFVDASSELLGIGTSTPTNTLTLYDDLLIFDATSPYDKLIRLYDSDDDGVMQIFQNNTAKIQLHGNGTSYLDGGNVAIGSSTANYVLDVDGDFNVGEVGHANAFIVDAGNERVAIGTSTPVTDFAIYNGNATTTMQLKSGGASKGGRFILEDSDAAGCTECYALNGTLTCAIITCP